MEMRTRDYVCLPLLLFSLACSKVEPGALKGRVRGLIVGQKDALGIRVEIQREGLDRVRTTVADSEGRYSIENLPPGNDYQVTLLVDGYREQTRHGVLIQPGEVTILDTGIGRWRKARAGDGTGLTAEQQEAVEKLNAIGYLQGYEEASEHESVTVHEPALAHAGLNLYVSGHDPAAYLMDMDGNLLHEWSYEHHVDWMVGEGGAPRSHPEYWRRVHAFPNGDLLAIYEGLGIIKLDRRSHLIWVNRNGAHHDLQVTEDSSIHVLTRIARLNTEIHPTEPVLEDFISVLTPEGVTSKEFSLFRAYQQSPFRAVLEQMGHHSDLFHTNTLEIFDGRLVNLSPLFQKGYALISSRVMSNIAIVDCENEQVVWSTFGDWKRQHQPTLLENGHLLLFDNLDTNDSSKVIELDPQTKEIVWAYRGDPPGSFFSSACGSNQRLLNGNTLITESNNGRAFEVTTDGKLVWEFHNPNRAGARQELVATLFDLIRLEKDYFSGWTFGASED